MNHTSFVCGLKRLCDLLRDWQSFVDRNGTLRYPISEGWPAMEHIGIDIHKRESQICILTPEGEIIEQRIQSTRDRFTAVFAARARARVLLEATTESEWVAQTLEACGHEVIVADPNYAPMYPERRRRVKTDRRDARMLAEACRVGTSRPAHRVSAEQRQVRRQLRVRDLLVRARGRTISLMRALVRSEGLRVRAGGVIALIAFIPMLLSLGLFGLVINTFLLWLTDKLVDDFEIGSLGMTFLMAVLLTLGKIALRVIL